jgi:hypothetical protein
MTLKSHNLGIALALLAGLSAIAFATWPIIPLQSRGDVGAGWAIAVWIIGGAFIASAFLADRYTVISKTILFAGAAILVGSTVFFGQSFSLRGFDITSVLPDLIPAALGFVAGLTIGPIQRSVAEIRAEQSPLRLPEQPSIPKKEPPIERIHRDRAA